MLNECFERFDLVKISTNKVKPVKLNKLVGNQPCKRLIFANCSMLESYTFLLNYVQTTFKVNDTRNISPN